MAHSYVTELSEGTRTEEKRAVCNPTLTSCLASYLSGPF